MQALDRIVGILEVVSASIEPPGLSDIARETNLSASSCHRLLGELVEAGLLRRTPEGRGYVPGPQLKRLSELVRESINESKADHVLRDLVDAWDESFYLLRMTGAYADVPVQRTPNSEQRMLVSRLVWRPFANHAGAGARVIMAFGDAKQRDLILGAASFERFTEYTKTEIPEILDELRATYDRGYGVSDQEFEIGVVTYATPILLEDGNAIGALCVIGPRDRLRKAAERGMIRTMQEASRAIASPDLFEAVR